MRSVVTLSCSWCGWSLIDEWPLEDEDPDNPNGPTRSPFIDKTRSGIYQYVRFHVTYASLNTARMNSHTKSLAFLVYHPYLPVQVIIRAICAAVIFITDLPSIQVYGNGVFKPQYAYPWVALITNCSQIWALYCLVLFVRPSSYLGLCRRTRLYFIHLLCSF